MRREPGAVLHAALRWRWLLVLQVALALSLGAVLYAESLPVRYEATAVVSFTPEPDVGADVLRVVLPKYPVVLSSPALVDEVARASFVPEDELRQGLSITTPAETANLLITVTLLEPRAAAAAANALAARAEQVAGEDRVVSAAVVASAVADSSESMRSRRLVELAGIALGLLVGVLAAVLAEQSQTRLWSEQDLRTLLPVPVAGRLRSELAVRLPPVEAMHIGVSSRRMRDLRAALASTTPGGGPHVVLVTGATRAQGATTVATLLAASTSAGRGRTLLVDTDLTEAAIAERMGLDDRGDLVRALRGERAVGRIARAVTPTLHVLTTDRDEAAADLLERGLEDLVGAARQSYTDIVLDGPPVLDADLGTTSSRAADAVVLVVRHGASVAQTRDALEALQRRGAPVVLVANEFSEPGIVGARRSSRLPLLTRWRPRRVPERTA